MMTMIVRLKQLSWIGLLMFGVVQALRPAAAEEGATRVPAVSAIAVIQKECMSKEGGLSSFQQQFNCIDRELDVAGVDWSDPYLQLYLLSGRKTLDDVLHKRLTSAAARVELQKALMDVTQRYNDAFSAKTLAQVAQQKTIQEDARKQREAEIENSRLEMERARAEQNQLAARAAVQHCINAGTEKRIANRETVASLPTQLRIRAQMQLPYSDNDLPAKCASDPMYYESIVLVQRQSWPVQTTSRCTPDGGGGFNCTSQ